MLVITGIGGLQQILEAASTRYLGKDLGMLYIGADNPYDTGGPARERAGGVRGARRAPAPRVVVKCIFDFNMFLNCRSQLSVRLITSDEAGSVISSS
jgi:hypothetical protein